MSISENRHKWGNCHFHCICVYQNICTYYNCHCNKRQFFIILWNSRAVTNFFPVSRMSFNLHGISDGARSLGSGYQCDLFSTSLCLLQFILLWMHGEHLKRKCCSKGANGWVAELPREFIARLLGLSLFLSLKHI